MPTVLQMALTASASEVAAREQRIMKAMKMRNLAAVTRGRGRGAGEGGGGGGQVRGERGGGGQVRGLKETKNLAERGGSEGTRE